MPGRGAGGVVVQVPVLHWPPNSPIIASGPVILRQATYVRTITSVLLRLALPEVSGT